MSALLAVGLILAPVAAPAPAPAAPAATPTAAVQQEKLVCRYQSDPDLGSHIARSKKVCMRKSEWRDLEALNEQMSRKLQEQGRRRTDHPGGFSAGN